MNEIVDNIQYSSGLGASDHISFSMCLICNPELKNSSTVKYNFYRGDYVAINSKLQAIN